MGTTSITISPNDSTEPKVYKYQFYVNGNPCAGKIVTITQEGKEPDPEACYCDALDGVTFSTNELDASGGTNVVIGAVNNLQKCDPNDTLEFTITNGNFLHNITLEGSQLKAATVDPNESEEQQIASITPIYNGHTCSDKSFGVTQKESTSCTCNDISISLSGDPSVMGNCLGWQGPERMSAYTIGSLVGEVSLCDGDELGSLEFVSSEDFIDNIHLQGNLLIANINRNMTPYSRTTRIGVKYKGEVCEGEGKSFDITQCPGSEISKVINVDLHCNSGIDVFGSTVPSTNGVHMYLVRQDNQQRFDVGMMYDVSSDAENTLEITHGCNREFLTEKTVTGVTLTTTNINATCSLHFTVDNLIVCGESSRVSQNSALYIKNTGYRAETCEVGTSGDEQYAHWVINNFNPANGFNDMQLIIRGNQQQAKPFGWDCNCETEFEEPDTYVVDSSGTTIQMPYSSECTSIQALQLSFYPSENSGGCSVDVEGTNSSGIVTVTIGENASFIGRDINLSINTIGEPDEQGIVGACQYRFTFIQNGGNVALDSGDENVDDGTDGDNTESPEDTENPAKQGFFDPDLDLMDNPVNPWK